MIPKTGHRTVVLLASLLLLLLSNQHASAKPLSTRANRVANTTTGTYVRGPVMDQNFPDPSIVYADGYWWAFATMDADINIQVAKSPDFETWTYLDGVDALPEPPEWVEMSMPNTWAPDVNMLVGFFGLLFLLPQKHKCPIIPFLHGSQNPSTRGFMLVFLFGRKPPKKPPHAKYHQTNTPPQDDGSFVMYFSATTTQDLSKHCIGAATSPTIEGPYTPINGTIACPIDQGGAIDASGFKDWEMRGSGWGPGAGPLSNSTSSNSTDDSYTGSPAWSNGGAGGQRYVVYKVDGNSPSSRKE